MKFTVHGRRCPLAASRFDSHLPCDSHVIRDSDRALHEASIEETVIAQLNRARTVQAEWAESTVRDRIAVVKSLRLRIAQDPRGLARSVNRENAAETLAE